MREDAQQRTKALMGFANWSQSELIIHIRGDQQNIVFLKPFSKYKLLKHKVNSQVSEELRGEKWLEPGEFNLDQLHKVNVVFNVKTQ